MMSERKPRPIYRTRAITQYVRSYLFMFFFFLTKKVNSNVLIGLLMFGSKHCYFVQFDRTKKINRKKPHEEEWWTCGNLKRRWFRMKWKKMQTKLCNICLFSNLLNFKGNCIFTANLYLLHSGFNTVNFNNI